MTATNPLFNLESPIRNTSNSVNILEMILETLFEREHPLPSAQVDGCRALLLDKRDAETLFHALYSAVKSAQSAVDAFDAAWEKWRNCQALDKAA